MAAGALVAGHLADRLGRRRAVVAFLVTIAATIAALAVVLWTPWAETPALRVVLAALYVAIGAFTASTYALFMDLTDPQLGATQFSAYMGATNLCEVWAAYLVGRLIGHLGYPPAFLIMAAVSLLASLIVIGLPARRSAGVAGERYSEGANG